MIEGTEDYIDEFNDEAPDLSIELTATVTGVTNPTTN
mgnify:CR=1 FL=1